MALLKRISLATGVALLVAASGVSARTLNPTPLYNFSDLRGVSEGDITRTARPAYVSPNEVGFYIVQLKDPALAMYEGTLPNLPAARRIGTRNKLDVKSSEAQAYVSYLKTRHGEFLASVPAVLGRSVTPVFEYEHALNGMTISITATEAEKLKALPSVKQIDRSVDQPLDSDRGPAFIGAPTIWAGTAQGSAPGSRGEGVVFGDIDSGANFDHPSFAATGADGYTVINPLGAGVFLGACNPPGNIVTCNNKTIGAYDFMTPVLPATDATNLPGGGEADSDHGSHTASTAVGNVVNSVFNGLPVPISGVAPHANLIVYDACYTEISTGRGLCPSSATSASVNQAIANGVVDVLNFSIGGGTSPWTDPTSQAFQAAQNVGITTSASAGNAGPAAATLGHVEPWTITTAASTHDRLFTDAGVTVTGPGSPPANITNIGAIRGTGPAQVAAVTGTFRVYTTNIEGCTASGGIPAGTYNGIALIRRGTCGFLEKVQNATAAGATGVVMYNNRGGAPIVMGALETTTIPSVMVGQADGLNVQAFLVANATATGTFVPTPTARSLGAGFGDIMADFSSRGPSPINVLKPNVSAPGVAILAAYSDEDGANGTPAEFGLLQGTSMSSPHNAGAAVLLTALRPTWTPSMIQSVLTTTGITAMFKEDGTTAATPFDRGGGRIDLTSALGAGLVMSETNANYTAANPATGGDPRTLNVPGLMNNSCVFNCSFVRRFTNVTGASVTWTASFALPAGVTGTVTPAAPFTLAAGATQTLTIALNVSGGTPNVFNFGQMNLVASGTPPPAGLPVTQHVPIAVVPTLTNVPASVTINTRRNAGSQTIDGLQSIAAPSLDIRSSGLVQATHTTPALLQDPTLGDAYDDLNQVYVTTYVVPAGSSRLVVETSSATSPDADLFVGTGATPGAGTEVCASATATAVERCVISAPAAGTYWVVVQNFDDGPTPPDVIDVWIASPPLPTITGTSGNMYATGPATVTAGAVYNLRAYWNIPTAVAGDRWYGSLRLGSTAATSGDIGDIGIDLRRAGDDVVKTANVSSVAVGSNVTYTITVNQNVAPSDLTYTITDAIPAGMTYVPGSAAASTGTVSVAGSNLTWTGVQTGINSTPVTYAITTSVNDAACTTGFPGGYLDLATNVPPFNPNSGVSGDSVAFTSFSTGAQFSFYGINYTGMSFSDDGFAFFNAAANYGTQPFIPQVVPNPSLPNNLLAMFWRDMQIVYAAPPVTRGVTLVNATSGEGAPLSIIEYDDIQVFGQPADTYDFEIVARRLRDDVAGRYEYVFAYANMTGTQTIPTTIGAESVGGIAGVAFVNQAPTAITNGMMICLNAVNANTAPTTITFQATATLAANGTTVVNNAVHSTDNPGGLPATATANVVVGILPDPLFSDGFE